MANQVLIVIDIQNNTTALLLGKKKFINRVNSVIQYFKENHLPIIYVKQSGAGKIHKGVLVSESDYVITKNKPTSFSSSEFCQILDKLGATEMVITGLMSNACVQATSKSALKKGYQVTLIEDGHDSIIKPMRGIFNKILHKKGANLISCTEFISDK